MTVCLVCRKSAYGTRSTDCMQCDEKGGQERNEVPSPAAEVSTVLSDWFSSSSGDVFARDGVAAASSMEEPD